MEFMSLRGDIVYSMYKFQTNPFVSLSELVRRFPFELFFALLPLDVDCCVSKGLRGFVDDLVETRFSYILNFIRRFKEEGILGLGIGQRD